MTKCSEAEFVKAWGKLGSPRLVSESLGLSIRNIYDRRAALAKRGVFLPTIPIAAGNGARTSGSWSAPTQFERRRKFEVTDGTVVLFSDPHWLPDHSTTAHDALEEVIRELKPVGVICGGDAVDGAQDLSSGTESEVLRRSVEGLGPTGIVLYVYTVVYSWYGLKSPP